MSKQLDDIMTQVGEKQESGASVLDDVHHFIGRFCVFPSNHCQVAVTLWAALTHAIEHFYTAPRLALMSPEPSSGKTRVLEVLELLVPNPMFTLNASAATIFRSLAERQISLLFDEVDAIWKSRGSDDNHEDLRALLNAGYKCGAQVPRCVGKNHEVQLFKVFCATALAGVGELPETILSRSVIIKMRRRAPDEPIEPFRSRIHESEGHALRERLALWLDDAGEAAGNAWPKLPDGIVDRPAEIWEPLIAIADAAGAEWPLAARKACKDLCASAQDRRVSLGIRLLTDLKTVFGAQDKLSTAFILDTLTSEHSGLDDDAPWSDLYGKPIDSRKLARLLRPYGIHSKKIRIDDVTRQGYERVDLDDCWKRWLPIPTPAEAEQAEQAEQIGHDGVVTPFSRDGNVPDSPKNVPDVPERGANVPDSQNSNNGLKPAQSLASEKNVPDVPDVPANRGGVRDHELSASEGGEERF